MNQIVENFAETSATHTVHTTESVPSVVQNNDPKTEIKLMFLSLLEEDDAFAESVKKLLNRRKPKAKKATSTHVVLVQTPVFTAISPSGKDVAFEDMPFWKLYPNLKPVDTTQYALKKEVLEGLQELFKDEPPIEELLSHITK